MLSRGKVNQFSLIFDFFFFFFNDTSKHSDIRRENMVNVVTLVPLPCGTMSSQSDMSYVVQVLPCCLSMVMLYRIVLIKSLSGMAQ